MAELEKLALVHGGVNLKLLEAELRACAQGEEEMCWLSANECRVVLAALVIAGEE